MNLHMVRVEENDGEVGGIGIGIGILGEFVKGFGGVVLPKFLAEVEGFVGFEGESVEGADGDMLVVMLLPL